MMDSCQADYVKFHNKCNGGFTSHNRIRRSNLWAEDVRRVHLTDIIRYSGEIKRIVCDESVLMLRSASRKELDYLLTKRSNN